MGKYTKIVSYCYNKLQVFWKWTVRLNNKIKFKCKQVSLCSNIHFLYNNIHQNIDEIILCVHVYDNTVLDS